MLPSRPRRLCARRTSVKPCAPNSLGLASALVLTATLLVMGGCSRAGVLSRYNPEDDAKKLQGTWRITRAISNGEVTTGDARLSIDGDRYVMRANGAEESSTFTLGTGGPRTIRVFHHENPLAAQGFYGGTLTGIYELSGNQLRICFDGTGRQYPASFDASQGSRRIIYELVRD
jgi:uncharacterized protein (TIGR03067 family)